MWIKGLLLKDKMCQAMTGGASEASEETKHWRSKRFFVNNGLPLQCFVCSEPDDGLQTHDPLIQNQGSNQARTRGGGGGGVWGFKPPPPPPPPPFCYVFFFFFFCLSPRRSVCPPPPPPPSDFFRPGAASRNLLSKTPPFTKSCVRAWVQSNMPRHLHFYFSNHDVLFLNYEPVNFNQSCWSTK